MDVKSPDGMEGGQRGYFLAFVQTFGGPVKMGIRIQEVKPLFLSKNVYFFSLPIDLGILMN